MNLPFHVIGALPLAGGASGAEGGNLDTGTVVLGLLVVAVVWLARSLVSLRTELEELRETHRAGARPVPPVVLPSAGPTPGEIAAIAAAVHCVLGARARLVAVGAADASGQQAWSREGRRQVFQSHQLR
jgi:hypothetical protein